MPRRRNSSKTKNRKWPVSNKNLLDLPLDVTENILHRLGTIEILESAQKVCTTWYKICKDPSMWRVIDMHFTGDVSALPCDITKMFKIAIDRSQGKLVEMNIGCFGNDELITYMAERSSQLRRLQVAYCYDAIKESWSEFFKKVPLLEELSLISTYIPAEAIAHVSAYCHMLRSFKYIKKGPSTLSLENSFRLITYYSLDKEMAVAAANTQLRHLQIVGYAITKSRLKAILDGFPRLESLDISCCLGVELDGGLKERCVKQIKDLRLPKTNTDGCTSSDCDVHDLMFMYELSVPKDFGTESSPQRTPGIATTRVRRSQGKSSSQPTPSTATTRVRRSKRFAQAYCMIMNYYRATTC